MERRKAITAAAATSLTMLAAAAGIAVNSGIVGADGDSKVGQLTPVSTSSQPVTVYVDDPTTSATVPAAPTVVPAQSDPVVSSSASTPDDSDLELDDDEVDDDSLEADDRDEDERYEEDDNEEHDGAEDDD